jgi:hypothetical protein
LIPIGDVESALQNDEMFILILVDMHWRTVPRIRNQLKRRKRPLCFLDGGADFETFSRRYLQPFTIAVMPVRQNCGSYFRCCHLDLPISTFVSR